MPNETIDNQVNQSQKPIVFNDVIPDRVINDSEETKKVKQYKAEHATPFGGTRVKLHIGDERVQYLKGDKQYSEKFLEQAAGHGQGYGEAEFRNSANALSKLSGGFIQAAGTFLSLGERGIDAVFNESKSSDYNNVLTDIGGDIADYGDRFKVYDKNVGSFNVGDVASKWMPTAAYTGGIIAESVVEGIIMSALAPTTGGASLGASITELGSKANMISKLWKGTKALGSTLTSAKGLAYLNVLSASSIFHEGAMEAGASYKENKEELTDKLLKQNEELKKQGKKERTTEEIEAISHQAALEGADRVMALNTILAGTEYLGGKLFTSYNPLTGVATNPITKLIDKVAKGSNSTRYLMDQILETTFNVGEEVLQEGVINPYGKEVAYKKALNEDRNFISKYLNDSELMTTTIGSTVLTGGAMGGVMAKKTINSMNEADERYLDRYESLVDYSSKLTDQFVAKTVAGHLKPEQLKRAKQLAVKQQTSFLTNEEATEMTSLFNNEIPNEDRRLLEKNYMTKMALVKSELDLLMQDKSEHTIKSLEDRISKSPFTEPQKEFHNALLNDYKNEKSQIPSKFQSHIEVLEAKKEFLQNQITDAKKDKNIIDEIEHIDNIINSSNYTNQIYNEILDTLPDEYKGDAINLAEKKIAISDIDANTAKLSQTILDQSQQHEGYSNLSEGGKSVFDLNSKIEAIDLAISNIEEDNKNKYLTDDLKTDYVNRLNKKKEALKEQKKSIELSEADGPILSKFNISSELNKEEKDKSSSFNEESLIEPLSNIYQNEIRKEALIEDINGYFTDDSKAGRWVNANFNRNEIDKAKSKKTELENEKRQTSFVKAKINALDKFINSITNSTPAVKEVVSNTPSPVKNKKDLVKASVTKTLLEQLQSGNQETIDKINELISSISTIGENAQLLYNLLSDYRDSLPQFNKKITELMSLIEEMNAEQDEVKKKSIFDKVSTLFEEVTASSDILVDTLDLIKDNLNRKLEYLTNNTDTLVGNTIEDLEIKKTALQKLVSSITDAIEKLKTEYSKFFRNLSALAKQSKSNEIKNNQDILADNNVGIQVISDIINELQNTVKEVVTKEVLNENTNENEEILANKQTEMRLAVSKFFHSLPQFESNSESISISLLSLFDSTTDINPIHKDKGILLDYIFRYIINNYDLSELDKDSILDEVTALLESKSVKDLLVNKQLLTQVGIVEDMFNAFKSLADYVNENGLELITSNSKFQQETVVKIEVSELQFNTATQSKNFNHKVKGKDGLLKDKSLGDVVSKYEKNGKFFLELRGLYKGEIDIIAIDKEGNIRVLDLKSSGSNLNDSSYSNQLSAYSTILNQLLSTKGGSINQNPLVVKIPTRLYNNNEAVRYSSDLEFIEQNWYIPSNQFVPKAVEESSNPDENPPSVIDIPMLGAEGSDSIMEFFFKQSYNTPIGNKLKEAWVNNQPVNSSQVIGLISNSIDTFFKSVAPNLDKTKLIQSIVSYIEGLASDGLPYSVSSITSGVLSLSNVSNDDKIEILTRIQAAIKGIEENKIVNFVNNVNSTPNRTSIPSPVNKSQGKTITTIPKVSLGGFVLKKFKDESGEEFYETVGEFKGLPINSSALHDWSNYFESNGSQKENTEFFLSSETNIEEGLNMIVGTLNGKNVTFKELLELDPTINELYQAFKDGDFKKYESIASQNKEHAIRFINALPVYIKTSNTSSTNNDRVGFLPNPSWYKNQLNYAGDVNEAVKNLTQLRVDFIKEYFAKKELDNSNKTLSEPHVSSSLSLFSRPALFKKSNENGETEIKTLEELDDDSIKLVVYRTKEGIKEYVKDYENDINQNEDSIANAQMKTGVYMTTTNSNGNKELVRAMNNNVGTKENSKYIREQVSLIIKAFLAKELDSNNANKLLKQWIKTNFKNSTAIFLNDNKDGRNVNLLLQDGTQTLVDEESINDYFDVIGITLPEESNLKSNSYQEVKIDDKGNFSIVEKGDYTNKLKQVLTTELANLTSNGKKLYKVNPVIVVNGINSVTNSVDKSKYEPVIFNSKSEEIKEITKEELKEEVKTDAVTVNDSTTETSNSLKEQWDSILSNKDFIEIYNELKNLSIDSTNLNAEQLALIAEYRALLEDDSNELSQSDIQEIVTFMISLKVEELNSKVDSDAIGEVINIVKTRLDKYNNVYELLNNFASYNAKELPESDYKLITAYLYSLNILINKANFTISDLMSEDSIIRSNYSERVKQLSYLESKDEEEGDEQRYDVDSLSINQFAKSTESLKRILYGINKYNNNFKKQTGVFGIPSKQSPQAVYYYLVKKLQGINPNFENYISTLETISSLNPDNLYLKEILTVLKSIKNDKEKQAFVVAVNKAKHKSVFLLVNNNGSILFEANANSLYRLKVNELQSLKDYHLQYNKGSKFAYNNKEGLKGNNLSFDQIKQLNDFYGFELSDSTINHFIELSNEGVKIEGVDFSFNNYFQSVSSFFNNSKFGIDKTFKAILLKNEELSIEKETVSYRDGDTTRFSYSENQLITDLFSEYKNQDYLEARLENIKNSKFSNSLYDFFNEILNLEESTKSNWGIFDLANSSLKIDIKGNKEQKIKDLQLKVDSLHELNEEDLELLNWLLYLQSNDKITTDLTSKLTGINKKMKFSHFTFPVLSDKNRQLVFKFPAYKISELSKEELDNIIFDQLVKPEAIRIIRSKESSTIDGYENGKSKFLMFPFLSNIKIVKENNSEQDIIDYLINNEESEEDKLKSIKSQSIDSVIKYLNQEAKKINSNMPEVRYDSKTLIEQEFLKEDELDKERLSLEYTLNKHLNLNYLHHLFIGDPALYYKKGKDANAISDNTYINVGKRMAALIAPRQSLPNENIKESDNYIQLFLEDPKGKSSTIGNIEKILRKDGVSENEIKKIVDSYSDIDTADAQEYITWKERLHVLLQNGSISKNEYSELTNIFSNNLPLTKENYSLVLKTISNPEKPVYTGMIWDNYNKVNRMIYIKSSAIPLIPQLVKGTELDNLRTRVEKLESKLGKPVRMSYQSANKVGAIKTPIKIWNEDNTFNSVQLDELLDKVYSENINNEETDSLNNDNTKWLELPRKYWGIQQETPFKSKKSTEQDKISRLTQLSKLLFNKTVFDKIPNSEGLFDKYNDLHKKLFELKRNELFNELSIDSKGSISNYNKFFTSLKSIIDSELSSRGYTKNEIEQLKLVAKVGDSYVDNIKDGDVVTDVKFNSPLWLSNYSAKFEALLFSIIEKRTIKVKFPGYQHILVSEQGWNIQTETAESNIIFTDPNFDRKKGLQGYRDENGINYAEIFVAPKFKDRNGNLINLLDESLGYVVKQSDGSLLLNKDKFDESLLETIGARIPTSGLISATKFVIKGFLPITAADTVILPKDFTKQMGLDFDIDKQNFYYNFYNISENGKIEKYQSDNESEKTIINDIIDIHKEVLGSKNIQSTILKTLNTDTVQNDKDLMLELTKKDVELFSPLSPSYQQKQIRIGSAGKKGTALYSLDLVLQSMLEQNTKVNTIEIDETKLTFKINGKPISRILGKSKSLNGDSIIEELGERQNMAVDNAKLQIMDFLGINDYTIGIDSLLVLLGYNKFPDKNTKDNLPDLFSTLLFNHPSITNLIKNSTLESFKYDIEEELNSKKYKSYKGVDLDLNYNTIKRGLTNQNNEKDNYIILSIFSQLYNVASELGTLKSTINLDSKGFSPTMEGNINTNLKLEELKSNISIFSNIDLLFNNQILNQSFESLQVGINILNNFLPNDSKLFSSIREELEGLYFNYDGKKTIYPKNRTEILNSLPQHLKAFWNLEIFKTIFPSENLEVKRKELKTKLGKTILQAKYSKNPNFENNLFLKNLKVVSEKFGIYSIEKLTNFDDNILEDDIINSFNDLILNPFTITNKYNSFDLAMDLFKYSLLIGNQNSTTDFGNRIPFKFINTITKNKYQELNYLLNGDINDSQLSGFIYQFVSHHADKFKVRKKKDNDVIFPYYEPGFKKLAFGKYNLSLLGNGKQYEYNSKIQNVPITPKYKHNFEALKEGSYKLSDIKSTLKSEDKLFDKLINVTNNKEITIASDSSLEYGGIIDTKTGNITINIASNLINTDNQFLNIIKHELIHLLTNSELKNRDNPKVKAIENLVFYIKTEVENGNIIFSDPEIQAMFEKETSLTRLTNEFIAELLSPNKSLLNDLNNKDYKGRNTSILDKFYKLISDLLGIDINKDSLLEESINLSMKLDSIKNLNEEKETVSLVNSSDDIFDLFKKPYIYQLVNLNSPAGLPAIKRTSKTCN